MSSPSQILKHYWGFEQFRELQLPIIDSILAGHDTLALLPTGGGKSICFQVPALCREGLCLVVSPLIALMRDQVLNLQQRGIEAAAIYSGMHDREIDITLDMAVAGRLKFLYLSPERLSTDDFVARAPNMNIHLIAIDEAHCISQWGYDFRPAYLKIASLRDLLPRATMVALTATATPVVVEDIQDKLLFSNQNVFQKSFARSNISYVVRRVEDKNLALIGMLQKVNGSAIIYVRNRRRTKEIADYLLRNDISAQHYHAGLTMEERSQRQSAWVANEVRVMVSTNAFGMGIDKPDVRLIIHIEPTESLEAYFQEAGRAGRDEQKAYAVQLVTGPDDEQLEDAKRDNYPSYMELRDMYDSICTTLSVAIHDGAGRSYDFDLPTYARQHSYSPIKVLNALYLLESQQLLYTSDGLQAPPKVKVIVEKAVLYKFQVEHRQYEPILKMLLRTCPGIFEDHVAFDEAAIGNKLNMTKQGVVNTLMELDKLDILSYYPRKDKPQITLLKDRVTKGDVLLDKKYVEERIKGYRSRIESVRQYITNQNTCRSKVLLDYFGERDAIDCGLCDVCLAKKKVSLSSSDFEIIAIQIIESLTEPRSVAELSLIVATPLEKLKAVIHWMIDSGAIRRTEGGMIVKG